MSGDVHVQFCERPGVRFPRATHLVILCEGRAAEALTVARRWMQALKLTLNETKTRTCDATQEPFDFLGCCRARETDHFCTGIDRSH